MGLFNNLMSKIFSHATPAMTTATALKAAGPGTATAVAAPPVVDVAAILNELAAKNREKFEWKHSIVDLMKLVGLDSSLGARKELAKDLGYTADMSDSATMNIWLHKQVLRKLAENGGKVPTELLG